MTKFSVLKNGRPLPKKLYTWNEKTKTFSTKEDRLVLDFNNVYRVTFNTGNYCTFKADNYCTFNTGHYCTFLTGYSCTFNTGSSCAFLTGPYCTFITGSSCAFLTNSDCTFKTGPDCTFNTGYSCIFKVGYNCYLIRYDVRGVTEIPANKKIQLNGYEIVGYTVIEEKKEVPTCKGEVIEIDGKKYKLVEGKE